METAALDVCLGMEYGAGRCGRERGLGEGKDVLA